MKQKNLEIYKDIFENIPEGMLVCDANFKIILANKNIANLSGYTADEIIDKNIKELVELNNISCPVCSSNTNSKFIPENFSHQADFIEKNENRIPVKINHSKFNDNIYIVVISPLSDAICLNQAHLDFVSTVSHELRTPLTSIKGFADTLLSSGNMLSQEQKEKFITIIKNQVDRLTRLVENLLTVSRLESRKDKSIYKEINFQQHIISIIQAIQPKAQNHKIILDIKPNIPHIWADSDKLEQIMTNLIDNAVKYSLQGTTITVAADFSPKNPDYVQIKVKDKGVGIPEEFLSKVFTKFSRIDNPLTRQVQGTGLGLYITKSLVERMGGRIFAESKGQGTTFTVILPVVSYEKQAAQKFTETKDAI